MTMAKSIEDMEAYSTLTDSVFYQIKNYDDKGLTEDQRKKLKEAQELLLNVERRKLYKLVAESPPIKREEKVKRNMLMKMEKEIKRELVAALQGELQESDSEIAERLRVQVVVFNLGMTKKGGLYQFRKNSPDAATVADTKNFSLLGFPETLFNELVVQVYLVPSEKPVDKETIAKTFQKWQGWKSRIEQLLEEPEEAASTSAPA